MLSDLADRVTARPMLAFLYYLAEVSAPLRQTRAKLAYMYFFLYLCPGNWGCDEMHIVPFSLNKTHNYN